MHEGSSKYFTFNKSTHRELDHQTFVLLLTYNNIIENNQLFPF